MPGPSLTDGIEQLSAIKAFSAPAAFAALASVLDALQHTTSPGCTGTHEKGSTR